MKVAPRIAIVFGGSRGIGAACVQLLSKEGWRVAYTSTSSDLRERNAYSVDVRNPELVENAFEKIEDDLGARPSAVIANAGINVPPGPVGKFALNDFRQLLEVNTIGAFNVLSTAARRVQDGGAIVAITTSLVRHAVAGAGPYAASKGAVESLIRSMAKELGGRRIRVNAVAPGPVDTALFHDGKTEEVKARMAALSPFDRIGAPGEIAEVVKFLLSDESSWVHGQIVQPNGGLV